MPSLLQNYARYGVADVDMLHWHGVADWRGAIAEDGSQHWITGKFTQLGRKLLTGAKHLFKTMG